MRACATWPVAAFVFELPGLHIVLKSLNLLLQLLHGHFVVLDGAHHLQLRDSLADGDELAGAPEEPFRLNSLDGFWHRVVVGLIIPGLDVKENGGLHSDLSAGALFVINIFKRNISHASKVHKVSFLVFLYADWLILQKQVMFHCTAF